MITTVTLLLYIYRSDSEHVGSNIPSLMTKVVVSSFPSFFMKCKEPRLCGRVECLREVEGPGGGREGGREARRKRGRKGEREVKHKRNANSSSYYCMNT